MSLQDYKKGEKLLNVDVGVVRLLSIYLIGMTKRMR